MTVFLPVKETPVSSLWNFPPVFCARLKSWMSPLSLIANLYDPALSVLTLCPFESFRRDREARTDRPVQLGSRRAQGHRSACGPEGHDGGDDCDAYPHEILLGWVTVSKEDTRLNDQAD